jgi:hypothetical protein
VVQATSKIHETLEIRIVRESAARENYGTVSPFDQEGMSFGHLDALEGCPSRDDLSSLAHRAARLDLTYLGQLDTAVRSQQETMRSSQVDVDFLYCELTAHLPYLPAEATSGQLAEWAFRSSQEPCHKADPNNPTEKAQCSADEVIHALLAREDSGDHREECDGQAPLYRQAGPIRKTMSARMEA